MTGPTNDTKRALSIGMVLAAALATTVAACGPAGDAPLRLAEDGVVLEVALDPATPHVGDGALVLLVHDAQGRPIEDAHVEASVRMPAMGAMAAMGGPAQVTSLGEGRHRAAFSLAMGSTWQVELAVHVPPDRRLRAEGSLTVGTPGLRLALVPSAHANHGEHAEHADQADPADPADPSTSASDGGARTTNTGSSSAPEAMAAPGEIVLPPDRLERSGIVLARAERKSLPTRLRAVGRVVVPEADQVDVSLKLPGWVARIEADAVGLAVRRGGVLFEVDSPALLAAAHEWVEALRSQAEARTTSAPDRADGLVAAARSRLARFGVDERELEGFARTGVVGPTIPIRSPISGFVVEKNVVQGAAFEAGDRLYRLAPLTTVWVEAEVYEADLARIEPGLRARVTAAHAPGLVFEAPVTLVSPGLDADARTTRVRIEVADAARRLRPNQFVDVELELPGDEAVFVPLSAVLQTGTRSFVFRAVGDGRFRPQPVEAGRRVGEEIEIRTGLAVGDTIVRSGTFLVAAESRLRAALEQWR